MWIQLITQIFLEYTVQQKRLQAAPERIKGMSVQAGIYFTGLCFFLVLALASLIMFFCDLGRQWEAGGPTHFTGFMRAALWQLILGAFVFAVLVFWARSLAKKKVILPESAQERPLSTAANPLLVFGEEFLTQLINKLK